jgi:hypothetical protein
MNMLEILAKSDGLPSAAFFGLAVVAVVKLLKDSVDRRGELATQLQYLAARWGGTFTGAGLFRDAWVQFEVDGRPAILEVRDGRSPFTQLRVTLPDARLGGLRIAAQGIGEMFRGLLDGPRTYIGDPIFDGEFAVRAHSGGLGRPETLTARLFSPERRQRVMTAVRRLNHCHGLSIEVGPSSLVVRIGEVADTFGVATAMVETAREFLGFLVDLDVVRPAVVAVEYSEQMNGHCPVCLSTLTDPLVRCPRCRSPHHRQCWEYHGRCATYGCQPGHRRVA